MNLFCVLYQMEILERFTGVPEDILAWLTIQGHTSHEWWRMLCGL